METRRPAAGPEAVRTAIVAEAKRQSIKVDGPAHRCAGAVAILAAATTAVSFCVSRCGVFRTRKDLERADKAAQAAIFARLFEKADKRKSSN
jgi:uncharacterized metal-binding protein